MIGKSGVLVGLLCIGILPYVSTTNCWAGWFSDALQKSIENGLVQHLSQSFVRGLQGGALGAGRANAPVEKRFRGRTIEVEVAYPFVEDGHVVSSLAHLCGQPVGESVTDLVRVKILNKEFRIAEFTVTVEVPGLARAMAKRVRAEPDETVVVNLSPVFGPEIGAICEKTPGLIRCSVVDDRGRDLCRFDRPVQFLAKNDFLLNPSYLPYLSVFVTPNHLAVDRLVTQAANRLASRAITGYQSGDPREVAAQVVAIYDEIKALGVRYRSSTNSFARSDRFAAQRITFPGESIAGKGANCVDGAVLFASALECAGLDAIVVVGETHAFVGVIVDPEQNVAEWIETTMVGSASCYEACLSARKTRAEWDAAGTAMYIHVKKTRSLGIAPFPFEQSGAVTALKLEMAEPAEEPVEAAKADEVVERCLARGALVLDGPRVDGKRSVYASLGGEGAAESGPSVLLLDS